MIPLIELNNGLKIPQFGLGTWMLQGTDCVQIVKKAIDLGVNHIDTANYYQNHTEIGKAIKEVDRSDLFITSKVEGGKQSYDNIIKVCNKSLKELNTDYLDLFLLHWPNRAIPKQEKFKALKFLVDENKVKSIGVSNFNIHHVQDSLEVSEVPIVTNQVEFHPLLYQKELLEFCNKNKIEITAYSPLARGAVFDNAEIVNIGKKYGKSAAQISLRWLFEKGMIIIPKTSRESRLKENMDLFDFKLDKMDLEILDNLPQHRVSDYSDFDLDY